MITLNLNTKGTEQELIKKYLEENASETLADKINSGVRIEKDGKTLINKKSLDGFMKYATDEARKLAEKGASSACVRSDVVFGWAIHYFEEESIMGKLYNEDGSEYKAPKPVVKKTTTTPATTYTPPVVKNPKLDQLSLFDFSNDNYIEKTIDDAEIRINTETGEVIEMPEEPKKETMDEKRKREEKELIAAISGLFGNDLEVRL
jgi:hypothetical protein